MTPIRRVLPSGVEVLVAPKMGAHVVSVQIYVWAGSLHESPKERGAAHFIEHMLFKGTAKRKVGEIGSLVEAAGGDINAYTTFDRTVYYLTLPSAQMRLGLDVLSDAVLASTFDPEELEREREVVLEEIRRGNDDPGALIGRKIFSLMYRGTEADRPIIGSEESVRGMSREDLLGFYHKHYEPSRMSVVVVGDIDPAETLKAVEEYFPSQLNDSHAYQSKVAPLPDFRRVKAGGAAVIRGDYAQTRLEVAFPAPSMTELDGIYVDLGAYVFGGSEMSRLQRRLRDRDRVVSAIGCSAYSPSFRGVFEISASVDPEIILLAARGIGRELGLFLSSEPALDIDIERASAAFRINRIHRDEAVDGVARALGVSLSTPFKEKFESTYERYVEEARAVDVMEGFRRSFDLGQVAIVALGSETLKVTEEDLLKSFKEGWAEGYTEAKAKDLGSMIRLKRTQPVVSKIELENGVSVLYRHLPEARMFCLMATTEGGLRFENTDRAGIFHAAAGMLGLATKERSYEEFTGRLEDIGSVVSGFSGKDSCGWEVHSILDHAKETIEMWAESVLAPFIPPEQWTSQQRETMHSFKMQMDSGSYRCMRQLSEKVYGKHPYSSPVLGWPETVEEFTAKSLEDFYKSWRDDGRWIIAAAGGMEPEELTTILNERLAAWKPSQLKSRKPEEILTPRKVTSPVGLKMDKEQAHVALGWRGLRWKDADRAALDVLMNILGGHGGRLFVKLRDQQSLAYTVSPLTHQGCEPGLVGAYLACKPDKVEQALFGMKKEFDLISSELVSVEELDRSVQHIVGSHEIGLQRTSSQAMTMGLMELYGIGWSDFERYPEAIKKVQRDDVLRIAKNLFATKQPVEVVVSGDPK